MSETPTLLLASQSPRRRALLDIFGWPLEVQPADLDETPLPGEHPRDYVRRLAEAKARALLPAAAAGQVIIAADTTVADGDRLLGKPASPQEALDMLRRLRGRAHQVHTGLAVLAAASGRLVSEVQTSQVHMRTYTEAEMQAYVRSGDPLDKAGAYAIQNRDFRPVERLEGCFASVMGLPLCNLARLLHALGLPAPAEVPALCQTHLAIHCDFHPQILPPNGDPP